MDAIKDLEKQIETLPKGYISKKIINNKVRYYRQWIENGKIKSKYIQEKEYMEVAEKISKRKELEKKLKLEKEKVLTTNKTTNLNMQTLSGEKLKKYCETVATWKERELCKCIRSYISMDNVPKVCVVYGLRRTGKTTMLLQVIHKLDDEAFNKTIYIKAQKRQSMAMLDDDLKKLYDLGYRYVFIDEVTFLDDFIDTASILSDIYAAIGMKIILSGTDSLGFWFANHEELYDRSYTIHTTWIPYAEHVKLLNINDIDEYIRYGGTLKAGEVNFDDSQLQDEEISFKNDETMRRYVDTAICKNIQHSLKCYDNGEHFRHLKELYENDELTGAINRVIEDMNHRFVLDVLLREFKSNDLALAKKNLLKEKNLNLRTNALEKIDTEFVTNNLMKLLMIKNKQDMKTQIKESHIIEIKEYLKALELIDEFPIYYTSSTNDQEKQTIITQPGLRYCQAEVLVHSLLKDQTFQKINNSQKNYIIEKILNEIKGRMMEEIVQLETMRKQKDKEVFKLIFDVGEYDMVVYNNKTNKCQLFEIKHSNECVVDQTKHLIDVEKNQWIEEMYGEIEGRYVIYRGENRPTENGVKYLNVIDYLCQV